jgi:TRAP transporter TAXI family solute receptor
MPRSKKTLTGLVGFILLGTALIALMTCHRKAEPQDLVITTGTAGGTYIKLGQLLKPILEQSGGPIGEVTWVPSEGSLENIDRLQYAGEPPCGFPRDQQGPNAQGLDEPRKATTCRADLAFVVAPAVVGHEDEVQVLMTLYADILQLVVNKKAEINNLGDLRGKKIFVGNTGSFTKRISNQVLRASGIDDDDFERVRAASFQEASERLQLGPKNPDRADAAFFMGGAPVEAVSNAMGSECCRLLSVYESGKLQGLERRTIPPLLYENQPDRVQTFQANALFVAREGLSAEIVQAILNALFDEVDEIAVANIRANEIRLWKAFDLPDENLKLHPGAKKFKETEKFALLVATGSIAGKYYNQGQMIQLLLQKWEIRTLGNVIAALWEQARTDFSVIPPLLLDRDRARARVVHTNGSLENARLVGQRPTLAIMQYDVALASRREKSSIYRTELAGVEFPELPDLQMIATLDTETLYVIARLERVDEQRLAGRINEEDVGTVRSLKGLRVCLGPEQSGTRAIAEAVLEHHGILGDVTPSYLIVPDMVHRLHSGEIDAGFIVSGLPSHTIETLLDDPQLRLLSLGARERAKIVESAPFDSVSIDPDKYASQPGGKAIRTIATRAVLVTNADVPFDVETITEAIFEGAAFLGIGESALEVTSSSVTKGEDPRKRLLDFMGQDLPSLPLHPGARAYYERAGLLPSPRTAVDFLYDWLTATWRTLAVLLILVTGYIGFISLKRDRTSNRIGREIFKIVLYGEDSGPVSQLKRLAKKRDVINRLVPERYFREDLDRSRWRELNNLIEFWRRVAKGNLTRDLADELRYDSLETNLNDAQRLDVRKDLLQRVRKHFEADQLEASQYELLTKLIQQELPE